MRTVRTISELREEILEKAILDQDFRSRLVDDPIGVLKSEVGIELPDGFNLQVHEDDGLQSAHIVLPPRVEMTAEELAEVGGAAECDGSSDYKWDC